MTDPMAYATSQLTHIKHHPLPATNLTAVPRGQTGSTSQAQSLNLVEVLALAGIDQ